VDPLTVVEGQVVVALNIGSSSLKLAVRDPEVKLEIRVERLGSTRATATVSAPGGAGASTSWPGTLPDALGRVHDLVSSSVPEVAAVAHRVVHGGPRHAFPAVVDGALLAELRALVPLAPLHLPAAIESMQVARSIWPAAVHVACFDTAFHHSLPDEAVRLPVPEPVVRLGVRRYGFHGLAVQSIVDAVPDLGQAVIAHLGNGCSVTAVADGRSRHNTMSLTPSGGVPSATRTGDLDPEVVLFLLEHGYDGSGLRQLVNHDAGFGGIAAGRSDMRDLLAARADGDPAADLAVRVFTRSVAMAVAGCAATLDNWDALVFSGGIGEHADVIRDEVCRRLGSLRGAGTRTDSAQHDLTRQGIRVMVVAADEEAVMDRQARALLAGRSSSSR
jgi:acetate kinase